MFRYCTGTVYCLYKQYSYLRYKQYTVQYRNEYQIVSSFCFQDLQSIKTIEGQVSP